MTTIKKVTSFKTLSNFIYINKTTHGIAIITYFSQDRIAHDPFSAFI